VRFSAAALALVAALALSAAGPPPAPLITGKYAPRDECLAEPGGRAFRQSFGRAVRSRNTAALLALTSDDVTLDFGGGYGKASLRRRLAGVEGPKLWHELDRLLPLGCGVVEGRLVAPWLYARFEEDDPFEVMIVTGARVPLLAAPHADARALRLLSWSVVEPLLPDDFEKPYRKVSFDGVEGYVAASRLRSPIDYRLIAERRGGRWQIAGFLAGD